MPIVGISQPQRIGFGPGCASACADEFALLQVQRAMLFTSPSVAPYAKPVVEGLMKRGIVVTSLPDVKASPGLPELEQILEMARAFRPDGVIGFGGGSVLEAAKLVACLCDRPEPVSSFFGSGLLPRRRIALACVPTTFGTGSESSPQAYLRVDSDKSDKVIASPWLVPDFAFFDPLYIHNLSADATAALAIQALAHCIETLVLLPHDSPTRPYAYQGIRLLARALGNGFGDNLDASVSNELTLAGTYTAMCRNSSTVSPLQILAGSLSRQHAIPRTRAAALVAVPLFRTWLSRNLSTFSEIGRLFVGQSTAAAPSLAQAGLASLESVIARNGLRQKISNQSVTNDDLASIALIASSDARLQRGAPRKYSVSAI